MVQATLRAPTRTRIEVEKQDGRLETKSPIELRNAIFGTLTDIAQIQNVTEINKVDNATIVYNAATQTYEIRPGLAPGAIDGGTF